MPFILKISLHLIFVFPFYVFITQSIFFALNLFTRAKYVILNPFSKRNYQKLDQPLFNEILPLGRNNRDKIPTFTI